MLQQSRRLARFARRHRRGQINQPFRIRRETTHDFQGSSRVLLANGDIAMEPRADDAFAGHVREIEQVVLLLLR